MIYTAREQNSTFVPTPAFKTRNLNLAPAKLLDLNIFTKPHHVQVAYGDYKHNIGAFCYATSIKESVLIGAKHFPFSNSYVPISPSGLPKTVFKIDESKNISAGNRAMLLKAVEKMSGTVKDLDGKAGTVCLLDKPIFSAIHSTLPQIIASSSSLCSRLCISASISSNHHAHTVPRGLYGYPYIRISW